MQARYEGVLRENFSFSTVQRVRCVKDFFITDESCGVWRAGMYNRCGGYGEGAGREGEGRGRGDLMGKRERVRENVYGYRRVLVDGGEEGRGG